MRNLNITRLNGRMCLPKDFGGLGIMYTRVWRMLKADDNDVCYNLLKRKYLRRKSFSQCEFSNGYQFWKGILDTRGVVSWGAGFKN